MSKISTKTKFVQASIAILPGDGIGPEVIDQALLVLDSISKIYGHKFAYKEGLIGGAAIEKTNSALPTETINTCLSSRAVLLGAVGDQRYSDPNEPRPEDGLLQLRKKLKVYSNIRPCKPLINNVLKKEQNTPIDFIVVRELIDGIYYGKPRYYRQGYRGSRAIDTMVYTEKSVTDLLKVAFSIADNRERKILHVVTKKNVLKTSQLWWECASQLSFDYSDVKLEHMLVDNAAMQIVLNPWQFDVIATENMFGDILSDISGAICGSLGMVPSASLSSLPYRTHRRGAKGKPAIYEPVHGAAPDLINKMKANPIAAILSVAMLLRFSLFLEEEAQLVEEAVKLTIDNGYRTEDIAEDEVGSVFIRSTSEMARAICDNLFRLYEKKQAAKTDEMAISEKD